MASLPLTSPQNYKFGWPPRIRTLIRRVKADCPAVERGAIMYSSIRKTYLRVKCFIYTRFSFFYLYGSKNLPHCQFSGKINVRIST
jgi:hypothetical protein